LYLTPPALQQPTMSGFDYAVQALKTAEAFLPFCTDDQLPPLDTLFNLRLRVLMFFAPPNSPPPNDKDLRTLQELGQKQMQGGPLDSEAIRKSLGKTIQDADAKLKQIKEQIQPSLTRMPLIGKFQNLRGIGLPLTAVQIANAEFENLQNLTPEAAGANPLIIYAQLIETEFQAGFLESAAPKLQNLKEKVTELSTSTADNQLLDFLKSVVPALEFVQARLLGNNSEARTFLEDLEGKRLPSVELRDVERFIKPVTTTPLPTAAVTSPAVIVQLLNDRGRAESKLVPVARYHFKMGVYALLEGKNDLARASFEKCRTIQGIDLAQYGLEEALSAKKYVELLDQYLPRK
jgi:hypothetical protein